MRHVVAAVLGLVLAPVLLYALGWGTAVAAAAWSDNPGSATPEALAAAGVLLVVGVGMAMLIRGLSPLTALIVGLGFLALNVVDLVALPASELLPRSAAGVVRIDWVGTAGLLEQNIIAMLGVAIVVSVLAPSRWRARRAAAGPDEEFWSTVKHAVEQEESERGPGERTTPVPGSSPSPGRDLAETNGPPQP